MDHSLDVTSFDLFSCFDFVCEEQQISTTQKLAYFRIIWQYFFYLQNTFTQICDSIDIDTSTLVLSSSFNSNSTTSSALYFAFTTALVCALGSNLSCFLYLFSNSFGLLSAEYSAQNIHFSVAY